MGWTVANNFQSMGEAPRIIGPMTSMSLVLDEAFVSLMVLHKEIRLASMILYIYIYNIIYTCHIFSMLIQSFFSLIYDIY